MSFRLAQLLLALATVCPYSGVAAAKIKPVLLEGLAVTFNSQNGGQEDTTVRPHFMLYVPLGQAPTPFVAPGAFTAEWEGVIQLDLRDHCSTNQVVLDLPNCDYSCQCRLFVPGKTRRTS